MAAHGSGGSRARRRVLPLAKRRLSVAKRGEIRSRRAGACTDASRASVSFSQIRASLPAISHRDCRIVGGVATDKLLAARARVLSTCPACWMAWRPTPLEWRIPDRARDNDAKPVGEHSRIYGEREVRWASTETDEFGNIRMGSAWRTSGGFAVFFLRQRCRKAMRFQVLKPVSGRTRPC